MNILLTTVGRRSYLLEYFRDALNGDGEVHASNSTPSPGLLAADKTVITPLIYDQAYIPFLLEYCKKNQIGLLLSLFDIDLPVLAAHRDQFEAIGTTVVVGDEEMVGMCNDKWAGRAFLQKLDIKTPDSFLTVEAAQKAVKDGRSSYPFIVKPRWGMGSLSLYEAENEAELEIFFDKCRRGIDSGYLRYEALQAPDSCVMIQEKIVGQEYGLDVINDLEGNYRATVAKRKLAMRAGETDCAKTVDIPELNVIGEKLGGALRHRGNLDVDVFFSQGCYMVLEMNARFGGGYPFSHMAGVDLPRLIVNWKLGKPIKEEWLKPKAGVCSQKDIRMVQYQMFGNGAGPR